MRRQIRTFGERGRKDKIGEGSRGHERRYERILNERRVGERRRGERRYERILNERKVGERRRVIDDK